MKFLLFLHNQLNRKLLFYSLLWMGLPELRLNYNFVSEFSHKSFKVKSITMICFINFLKDSHSNSVSFLKAKTVGSVEDISHLSSSDSCISIEGEYFVEFFKMSRWKNGIVVSNIFLEDGLKILSLNFLFGECHKISL